MSTNPEQPAPHYYCHRCAAFTRHSAECSRRTRFSFHKHPEDLIDHVSDFHFLRCNGCGSFLLGVTSWHSEITDGNGNRVKLESQFPPVATDNRPDRCPIEAPLTIREIYGECIVAYNTGSYRLVASGVRSCVEGVCNELGARQGSLYERIGQLGDAGKIGSKLAASIQELRLLGNESLHELACISAEDADIALTVLEHLLKEQFAIERNTDRLRARRRMP